MADAGDRVLRDIVSYRKASANLSGALERQRMTMAESAETMLGHVPLDVRMRKADSAGLRGDVSDRLAEFDTARRQLRVSLTAVLIDDGLNGVEVGNLFGVSRQAANRLVIEARRIDDAWAPADH
jgi:hypothetical protein